MLVSILRRRPNFLRSRKRKRCSQRCRREPIKGGGDFRNWHNAEVDLAQQIQLRGKGRPAYSSTPIRPPAHVG